MSENPGQKSGANSGGQVQQRHMRRCNGCGDVFDVTLLLPRRAYRCHSCGTVILHHPALASLESELRPFKRPLWPLRFLLAIALPAVMVWFAGRVGHLLPEHGALEATLAATAVVSALGCVWAWRLSRDGVGLVGVMLTSAGLGTAALMVLSELPEPARANSVILMALAWLGLGGTQLARFMRRLRLPAIGSGGLRRE